MNSPEKQQYSAQAIATAFVEARTDSTALPDYPGAFPPSLSDAYAAQDLAIERWPDDIQGWKVGKIPDPFASELGVDRLIGPIFETLIKPATDEPVPMGVFETGFAAVEGEFILEVKEDAPAGKTDWTTDEAIGMVGRILAGVEVASSPFPEINDHGPLVTISDFGNNYGLITGPEIPGLLSRPFEEWACVTLIDDEIIGKSGADTMPGGPIESLRYALSNAATRGKPLKKGTLVSTGAVTGVHPVSVGQTAEVRFVGGAVISCTFEDNTAHRHAAE